MEMMLQTAELCKSFKKQKAVNKVSLNIEYYSNKLEEEREKDILKDL